MSNRIRMAKTGKKLKSQRKVNKNRKLATLNGRVNRKIWKENIYEKKKT